MEVYLQTHHKTAPDGHPANRQAGEGLSMKNELAFAHMAAWCGLIVLSGHAKSPIAEIILTLWAIAHMCRAAFVFAGDRK